MPHNWFDTPFPHAKWIPPAATVETHSKLWVCRNCGTKWVRSDKPGDFEPIKDDPCEVTIARDIQEE
jgi:hypothetical protein